MSQHTVILLLGSNLGDTKKNIETAIYRFNQEVGKITNFSEFLITEPVEFVSSNIFCNIALVIRTHFSPIQLLKHIKRIENEMGRKHDSSTLGLYTDRVIDIDIVKFDNLKFVSEKLEIPHQKHLFEREFSKIILKDFI
ncbi:2-amino-4-hydroxy-6-hydroxymethyldihydropteridine diphosphokinase [Chryseobacterium camelliae]|uniref:2-amino-4-hydroxy-6-hydroxymethyldihydropteridine pyrophosphokinase n=1 Tax=Chryseobacterium camelliae TaxID=1265445 RepID=A0ABY7QSH0_9FLAO|nr:2-amino-4-hydroxy-6-hydroxymethyldihydropteridine diphosphokinase [Chryseobacterium camelliae]WBV61706.1 2-amino-4-hydroxy-6-hydroxymethyldihydropteridine diphosphokinase [Chryseobacterium camelliae]